MTSSFRLRGLTSAFAPTPKKPRPSASHTRDNRYRPNIEKLEDRTLMAYDLGSAFALVSIGIENALAVATDASGNVLVAGSYSSASIDLDPGPGEYILANAAGYDGYVAKYDPAGNLAWGVQVGTTDLASVYKVAADGAGNVLIMGIFRGSIEISAPGRPAVTLTNGGVNEGFLA